MSRFYGRLKGGRGTATRQGHKTTGFWSHVSGWNMGVEVTLHVDDYDNDVARIYITKGSGQPSDKKLLAEVVDLDNTRQLRMENCEFTNNT